VKHLNPLDALKDRAAALGRPLTASEGLSMLVTPGGVWGIPAGLCIMSIRLVPS
jgi:hypothetical protein